jgi:hypothetical protein
MSLDLRPRKRAGAIGNSFAEREEIPFARKGLCFLQHDMDVANGSGATVRADFNNAIEALTTLSSGATEPGTTYAYQLWADTTAGLLKQRNAANTAWEVRGTLAETLNVSRSSNTILAAADYMKFFVATASFTQTLTAAATLGDGWYVAYRVNTGVTITFDPNSSETIDGATTLAIVGPSAGIIFCDGSNFRTYGFLQNATQAEMDAGTADKVVTAALNRIALGTPVTTTSGTAHDFTVPAGTRRVTINLVGLSTNGTSIPIIQIGDAGGIEPTGYLGATGDFAGAANFTTGVGLVNSHSSTSVLHGSIVLTLVDATTFTWAAAVALGLSSGAAVYSGGASKALSAELTTVRLTTVNGTDAFDAGLVNIIYER